MSDAAIQHIPGQGFRLEVDGQVSQLDYRLEGDRLAIVHTGVPAALRGQGIAGKLVQAAVDHARANGLRIDPRCSYAEEWFGRHPEHADLLAGD